MKKKITFLVDVNELTENKRIESKLIRFIKDSFRPEGKIELLIEDL